MRPLTDDEIQVMITKFEGLFCKRDLAIFTIGCSTGFRIKEILSLKIKNIYSIENDKFLPEIHVQKLNMKKKESRPPVRYSTSIIKYIKDWIDEMGTITPNTPLFRSKKKNSDGTERAICVRSAIRIFKNTYLNAGIIDDQVGTHSCRKVFAKKCYLATGKDLIKTQRAMGHAKVDSTIKYLTSCDNEISDLTSGLNIF